METEIPLPSGLRGRIRGLRGQEAQAFVNPVAQRALTTMDNALSNCWLETTDPGPYALVDSPRGPQVPWGKALLGDRFEALIQIAVATYGSNYPFDVKCVNCTKQYGWELELTDLPRKPYPEESLEKFKSGDNSFFTSLPDGAVLQFKMSTGEEEKAVVKMQGGYGTQRQLGPVDSIVAQTTGIFFPEAMGEVEVIDLRFKDARTRIVKLTGSPVEIEGGRFRLLPGSEHARREYLERLDLPDLEKVLEQMQIVEGGVETKIETVCEFCGWQQEIQLPFRGLFSRRKKKPQSAES